MTNVTVKPWGKEILVAHTDRYALKDIHMVAGTRSSLQSHARKLETILVIQGRISLERGPAVGELETVIYGPGESYTLRPGVIHRVTVIEDARLVEASTPELDDVIRHADDYGRAGGDS
ncbi:MAG: cupin domain-containing protein [Alphaproteobacteria bacterium]|nr:cupin domain-containing protein [Alphaproteobacteria bacterium]